jgi:hypothetical protein
MSTQTADDPIPRMHSKNISVDRDNRIFELDDQFYGIILRAGVEIQQRVFVQAKLAAYAVQTFIG